VSRAAETLRVHARAVADAVAELGAALRELESARAFFHQGGGGVRRSLGIDIDQLAFGSGPDRTRFQDVVTTVHGARRQALLDGADS